MEKRPIVHCLVARPISECFWGVPQRTSLARAEALKRRGWHVIGPDPEDMIALALAEKKAERRALWPFT